MRDYATQMNPLFIFCWILFIAIHLAKSFIHTALNRRNGHSMEYGRLNAILYFLPYDDDVHPKDEGLKRLCNDLQKAQVLLLSVVFIWTIIITNDRRPG
jgi:hypothetical protein